MCNCDSNNVRDITGDDQISLDPNEFWTWDAPARIICVDACIKDQIVELWKNDIWTGGSCCGHNGKIGSYWGTGPNVVLSESSDAVKAAKVLTECDPDREWAVLQWQLVHTNKNETSSRACRVINQGSKEVNCK